MTGTSGVPRGDAPADAIRTFHRTMPGYAVTPLVPMPRLAAELSIASLAVKDESLRMGLPAFKILGASWAVNRALSVRLGLATPCATFDQLRAAVAHSAGAGSADDIPRIGALVTATDGNHGRALAHVARLLGLSARIHVPAGLPTAVLAAIRSEGAAVTDTGRGYDDAVRSAALSVGTADVLIQDTAWPGYEEVPQWIVDGYSTLFAEIDDALPHLATATSAPTAAMVPTGVGSLLQAALAHYGDTATRVVAVEPVTAACVAASLAAHHPVTVDTSAPTTMAGLNCGTVSSLAWPLIRDMLTAAVDVTDSDSAAAAGRMRAEGVDAGPCGAASVAGIAATLAQPDLARTCGLDPNAHVVALCTEGAAAR